MKPNRHRPTSRGPISSVIEQIGREKRTQIDAAIIDREPYLIKDIYACFDIASHGVSESAFYRYAARLRTDAALLEAAESALAIGGEPVATMSTLIDAEFIRVITAEPSPQKLAESADPFTLDPADIQRLHRLALIRNTLIRSERLAKRARDLQDALQKRQLDKPDPVPGRFRPPPKKARHTHELRTDSPGATRGPHDPPASPSPPEAAAHSSPPTPEPCASSPPTNP